MDAYFFFFKKEKSLLCKIYRYVWILRPKAAIETSLLYLILFYNDLFSYIFIFFLLLFYCFFIFQVSFCFLCDVIFLFSFFVLFFVVVVFFFLFIVRCSCFHVKNLFAPLVFEEQVNLKFFTISVECSKAKKESLKTKALCTIVRS